MRQMRWLELIKDNDLTINYTPGKANVVADALSRKATCNLLVGRELPAELQRVLAQMQIEFWEGQPIGTMVAMGTIGEMSMNLQEKIIEGQTKDPFLTDEIRRIVEGRQSPFELREQNSLWFQGRICVPDDPEIKEIILTEAHQTPYSIHPGST